MSDIITVKELFAIALRRGKLILCLAVVCMALVGGLQAAKQISNMNSPENSEESIEERYQAALKTYQEQQEHLQEQLDSIEKQISSQEEYNENSLKMKLDPYNVVTTTMSFSITDIAGSTFQQVFQLEGTPVDYVISRIRMQYFVYWNNLDLEQVMRGSSYDGVSDQYLREVVSLSAMDGGGLTLSAVADTEERSRELADAAYECLLSAQPSIGESAYPHQFTLISHVTKLSVDDSLDSLQQSNWEQMQTYQTNRDNTKKSLEDLKKPERENGYSIMNVAKTVIKWAALGAFGGAFLALVYIFLAYALQGYTESTRRVELVLSLTFLGFASAPKKFWERLASRIVGEKNWKEEQERLAYLKEHLKAYVPKDCKVTLVSTLPVQAEDAAVQEIIKAISEQGHAVRFVNRAQQNPDALDAVKDCDGIVLAEKTGVSRWDPLMEQKRLAKQMDKPIFGFISL